MLQVAQLHAYYGQSHVLHGVSFEVRPGEIVALLGRNGAGRSTTAKALMGLVRCEGMVRWQGQDLRGRQPFEIAQQGIAYVAEGRDIFPRLTVQQNLLLGQKGTGRWNFAAIYTLFPQLQARQHTLGGVLSGGEQQMLALGRALMGNPQLLIIDEPTEGLASQVVAQVAACLQQLQQQGIAVLLVEQKLAIALDISNRVLLMGRGSVVFDGTPQQLRADAAVRREWLEI
ncbi:amino acid/amide ABC transporter ATP-binding protein 2, HAAT family (TC 3.A.1.4.-) [Rhodoferax sp. OV413]|uniref:ABC transporter ATP-binding protein n=1 Tax=Rhodoferax sp. OV413 TaxID=1855285 RepID=UPI000887DC20|nr:ABC transporter ATP-binding protein [Rhodoferax sp. OV413]SDN95064.1 amino acid/amide ABC transporter ATP-binding protein 2, HAAT family (TC 3.A.1.4.-) [Rhodoferax sp. OV413]